MKDSFVIYTKYEEQISMLTDEQAGVLLRALIGYQSGKTLPKMDKITQVIFATIRQQMDYDNRKYEDIRRVNSENGRRGGRPSTSRANKGEEPKKANGIKDDEEKAVGFFGSSEKAKKALSESDTDTYTDTVTLERKKEKENITSSSAGVPACEDEVFDFSSFSDEELIDWGADHETDFSDEEETARFFAWGEEMQARGKARSWDGRIVNVDGCMGRLKSHSDIMDELCVSNALKGALMGFLRHCFVNHHLVTNDKLIGIITRLEDGYGTDEVGKLSCVERAIRGGFFDVKTGR